MLINIDKISGVNTKEYAKLINNGEIVVSEYVFKELKRLEDYTGKYDFIQKIPNIYINFIQTQLRIPNAETSRPFILELVQKMWIENMFGWWTTNDRGVYSRLVHEFALIVARGNGKTAFESAVVVTDFLISGKLDQEVVFLAENKDQADRSFRNIWGYFNEDMGLPSKFRRAGLVTPNLRDIRMGTSTMKVKAVDDNGKLDGGSASFAVFDELHAYRMDPTDDVTRGQKKLNNYLALYITTNGTVRDATLDNKLKVWRAILDGEAQNDSLLAFIYELDKDDDVQDETVWQKSNPLLNTTVMASDIRQDLQLAEKDITLQVKMLTKVFNRPANNYYSYFTEEQTHVNESAFDKSVFAGRPVVIGMDLSQKNDLSAFTAMVVSDDKYYFDTIQYMPRAGYEAKTSAEQERYDRAVNNGELIIHDKLFNDPIELLNAFSEHVQSDLGAYIVRAGIDFYGVANSMPSHLEENMIAWDKIGMNTRYLSDPMKMQKPMIDAGAWISHGELIKWNYSNVVARFDANLNVFPNKKEAIDKIDGYMSQLFAYVSYTMNKDDINLAF